ncbi:hypothetical protein F5Y07DRAFT_402626 [Xylaria sp. FL0933]|nr:hypothetical protein F5Y07DRAFT_402626 [Xylaria sp. FL0933]
MTPSKKRPAESDDASGPAAKKHRKGFRVGPENLPDGPWRRKVDKIKKDLIHKAKVKKAYKKIKSTELAASSFASKPTLGDVNAGSVTVVKTDTGDDGKDIRDGREDSSGSGSGSDNDDEVEERLGTAKTPSPQLHPQRQAMLNDDVSGDEDTVAMRKNNARRRTERSGDDDRLPEENQSHKPAERERYSRQKRRPGYFDKALTMAERKKAEAAERAAEKERREAERRRRTEERERFRRAMAKARKPGRDGQRRLGRESGLLLEKVKKMVD